MMGRLLIFLLLIIEIKGRCHHLGSALKCTGLTTFPNGSHNWAETVIISNSILSELEAYNFYHGGFCNAKNVYLQNDNITNIHPNAFAEMSQVVQLDLSENKLITFHKYSFIGLISVKILKLAKNEIEFIPGKVLRHLHSLEILDLSHNSLRTQSTGFLKWTSIKELYIGNNPLELPDRGAILESNSLTHLSLDSCGLESLPSDAFSKLPNIEYLDFSFNKLKVLPEDLLKGQDHLKHLDISYNAISRVEVFHIPTSLSEFYCDGNPFADDFSCKQMHPEVNSKVDAGQSDSKPTSALPHQESIVSTELMQQNGKPNVAESGAPNISADSRSTRRDGENILEPNEASQKSGQTTTKTINEASLVRTDANPYYSSTTLHSFNDENLVSSEDYGRSMNTKTEKASKLDINALIYFAVVVAAALASVVFISISTNYKKLHGKNNVHYAYSEVQEKNCI